MLRKEDASWSNPKVLAIFAVIFICGAAFGSAVTRSFLHSRMFAHSPEQHTIEAARNYGLNRLRTELNLSPPQEATITKVLDDYSKYYQNIMDSEEDVAEHGRRTILDVLTPEQQKRFNQIFGEPHRVQ